MARSGLSALGLVAAALLLHARPAMASPTGSDAVFRALLLARITAYGRGDASAYTRLLDRDFVHVSDLGARRTLGQMPAFVSAHAGSGETYSIASLHWRVEGPLAIVDAEVRERLPDHAGAWRESDVFVWRQGRWRYRLHHETAIAQSPAPVTVADDAMGDYVGRYRSDAGTVDAIELHDGKLQAGSAGGTERVALVQVGRGAFAFAGDPTLLVFVRDRSGSVVSCVWHLPSGQTTNAQRF